MDAEEFKEDFLETVKTASAISGEGSCASFVDKVAEYLIDAEVIPDFTPSFYVGKRGHSKYRVDGYAYDEYDNVMNLIIADYDGNDLQRKMTNTLANENFEKLRLFLIMALTTNLYKEIEMSTPCADLVDFLRGNINDIHKFRLLVFTDATMSASIKTVDLDNYINITVEGQIWDISRLYRVCCSDQGRQIIEINFKDYSDEGIPCLEVNSAETEQYKCYLGVISGNILADIYEKYGSKLLESNVRSFLSTKNTANRKIRDTIMNKPQMFFAYNNGIAATAMDIKIEDTAHGRFITYARDFQIINGGQTTASIFNARFKDKADLSELCVQMKLTVIGEISDESDISADELIHNISESSNSQSKVTSADFFASHPFQKEMEQISRRLFAPATNGAQYETKWFYERARGQYTQEQIRLTPSKTREFQLKNPKDQVITKMDLAKVQNTWLGHPDIVSKGAQTNFNKFAEYISAQWDINDKQFNEYYYKTTVSLMLIFRYLERTIPKQPWYENGYRANIICYTVALFKVLIKQQFPNKDLNLMLIWNIQEVPALVGNELIILAEKVLEGITTDKSISNVTQWCKRIECWENVKRIDMPLPDELGKYLISTDEEKQDISDAEKDQKVIDEIYAQSEVVNYPVEMWKRLADFTNDNHMASSSDLKALAMACKMPSKIPNSYQSKRLLKLLEKAKEEGFVVNLVN